MSIPLEEILTQVSPTHPGGEHDARGHPEAWGALQSAFAKGVPHSPNDAIRSARTLLKSTKDLQVAVRLTVALLYKSGVEGLCEGLDMLSALVADEDLWPHLHPALEAAPPALNGKANGASGDDLAAAGDIEVPPPSARARAARFADLRDFASVVNQVRRSPLLDARGLGSVTLRDLDIIAEKSGVKPDEKDLERATQARVDKALQFVLEKAPESLLNKRTAIENAIERIDSLNLSFAKHQLAQSEQDKLSNPQDAKSYITQLGAAGLVPDLAELTQSLLDARKVVTQWIEKGAIGDASDDVVTSDEANDPVELSEWALPGGHPGDAEVTTGKTSAVRGNDAPSRPGSLNSPRDVQQALDAVLLYYERYDRASPVPLLIRRARRLTEMDFLQVLQELLPESIEKMKALGGEEPVGNTADGTTEG